MSGVAQVFFFVLVFVNRKDITSFYIDWCGPQAGRRKTKHRPIEIFCGFVVGVGKRVARYLLGTFVYVD